MNAQTRLTLTDNYGQTYKPTSPITRIGSSPQCNIVLDEPDVLSNHAEIRLENGYWILQDMSGESGIGINGEKIQAPYQLNNGDVIAIGCSILRVFIENQQPTPTLDESTYKPSQNTSADLSGFRSSGEYTPASPPITNQSVATPPPVPTPKIYQKNRVTAAVLAITLGGLGVHKFYLGKPVQGIFYLIFIWTYIPAIIGFAEGLYYLSLNDQQFAEKFEPKPTSA